MPLSRLLRVYEIDMGSVCEIRRCTRQASRIVVVHRLDHCKDFPPTGNNVYLMCYSCSRDIMRTIRDKYERMKLAVAEHDPADDVVCTTCGKRFLKFTDLLQVEDLLAKS